MPPSGLIASPSGPRLAGEVRALGALAVGDLQERVLRRLHARKLDGRLEDPAVRRDVEEERAELLAHPEGSVGRADERLRSRSNRVRILADGSRRTPPGRTGRG